MIFCLYSITCVRKKYSEEPPAYQDFTRQLRSIICYLLSGFSFCCFSFYLLLDKPRFWMYPIPTDYRTRVRSKWKFLIFTRFFAPGSQESTRKAALRNSIPPSASVPESDIWRKRMKVMSVYIAIDMKSFYASVECVARGLDPLKANLLVADPTRSD